MLIFMVFLKLKFPAQTEAQYFRLGKLKTLFFIWIIFTYSAISCPSENAIARAAKLYEKSVIWRE